MSPKIKHLLTFFSRFLFTDFLPWNNFSCKFFYSIFSHFQWTYLLYYIVSTSMMLINFFLFSKGILLELNNMFYVFVTYIYITWLIILFFLFFPIWENTNAHRCEIITIHDSEVYCFHSSSSFIWCVLGI